MFNGINAASASQAEMLTNATKAEQSEIKTQSLKSLNLCLFYCMFHSFKQKNKTVVKDLFKKANTAK